tara:strand:- start:659 stop:904 length:246 start_codon:yes stop_codon:yes gene_type:complete
MELAGSYMDINMPGKEKQVYPLAGFTTDYSGPLHKKYKGQRMESMGDVKSASVPRNARPSAFASPGSKGSGFANVNTKRQF